MQLSRRCFIKAVSAAAVAGAVAIKLPAPWLPTLALKRETALEYLRRSYNDFRNANGRDPKVILVGQELFDAAESQMVANMRFVEFGESGDGHLSRSLKFKAAVLRISCSGWQVVHAA